MLDYGSVDKIRYTDSMCIEVYEGINRAVYVDGVSIGLSISGQYESAEAVQYSTVM